MQFSGAAAALPLRFVRSSLVVVTLALVLLASSAMVFGTSVRAAASRPSTAQSASDSAAPLKAVFIVGPAGSQTAADLADAEALAQMAESYGMDVRRVFHPHATWEAVMSNIQGANLVYYAGHGYGWPSPYTKVLTESRQDGVGLNTFDGSSSNQYTYYGATVLRQNWILAPNALVFLNHDCYTAGNSEPGQAIPSWDLARTRVDNFASGFLAVGARAVFALSYQKFNKILMSLFTTDLSVEDLFRLTGSRPRGVYGWVGNDPRKFDSVRTPGAQNFMDPDPVDGFIRAVTGDLTMTAAQWASRTGGGQPPTLSTFAAQAEMQSVSPGADMFTPNGDGVADALEISFAVDRESFLDITVRDESNNVVRSMSTWSPGGQSSATWDGKNDAGGWVGEGTYQVSATPRNRAGDPGNTRSFNVGVFNTMRAPTASPTLFYAADGDSLARTTTLTVNLDRAATFWWKIADASGSVVRTYLNGVSANPGPVSWQWDGKDSAGAYVPDGTYYSVTTAATSAGTYFHKLALDVRAFRLTPAVAGPFVRGQKVKFFIFSAETLPTKPKLKVYAPGVTMKSYGTYNRAAGGYYVNVTFPAGATAGTVQLRVTGTDSGAQVQQTDYFFPLH